MKTRPWLLFTGAIAICVVLSILVLKPVPIQDEKDCLKITSTVAEIHEGGDKDVVFKLKDHKVIFYVNRGLERGLDLSMLQSSLTNQEITITYPNYWTPLNLRNSVRHVSKIDFQGRTIFTELN